MSTLRLLSHHVGVESGYVRQQPVTRVHFMRRLTSSMYHHCISSCIGVISVSKLSCARLLRWIRFNLNWTEVDSTSMFCGVICISTSMHTSSASGGRTGTEAALTLATGDTATLHRLSSDTVLTAMCTSQSDFCGCFCCQSILPIKPIGLIRHCGDCLWGNW